MNEHFEKVKSYILELGYSIDIEDESDGILVISEESAGISKLVIGCAPPLLIMEQFIMDLKVEDAKFTRVSCRRIATSFTEHLCSMKVGIS